MKDYNDFFNDHEDRLERELRRRPVCECCKEHIQDEKFYYICDTYICLDCIDEFLEDTDNYLSE